MSDDNLVRIGLDIKDGMTAREVGVDQPVISLAVDPNTGILHIAAFHYAPSDEGARIVADILRTAADGIDRELGPDPEAAEAPKRLRGSDMRAEQERATQRPESDDTIQKPRPRFNPKPRGGQ